ncbi:MAG: GNAT family N-acetyltransferase [Pseudomonadales bacterium]|nr:GNAT family N-acetyltransferase [Pseudomonadales bacterium]
MDYEIELARPTDALTLGQMSRDLVESGLGWSWKPSRILSMIQHPDVVVIVARTRFGVAGFAIMEFHETRAHLNLLAVKPTQRRAGIGRALVAWLEESARIAGIEGIYLEVRVGNNDAQAFYKSLGFTEGKVVKGYYRGRESAMTMLRELMSPEVASQRP